MTKTELKQNWNNVLDILSETMDQVQISVYFGALEPHKIVDSEDRIYLISKENSGFYQNFIKRHQDEISVACNTVFGRPLVAVVIGTELPENEEPDEQQKEDSLNPKYTFDSFVAGPTNRLALAASLAVADGFSHKYNPLFIYADSGLGKTHLLHAIGHFVKKHKPKKKVLYVSSETFISELIESIRTKKQAQFKDKYRKVDYLLFDDVQFITGNKAAEDELFNTFEALFNSGKQLVFASDRPPAELGNLPKRLSTRFVWGMTVDIQSPDYETRMAILKNKALLEDVDINNKDIVDMFDIIAQNVHSNIRELEGAFTRVLAFSSLSSTPMNRSLAKKVLSDIISENDDNLTPDKIKIAVADYYGISVSDIESSKRVREIAYPRHIAIYLIRTNLNLSFPAIGKLFGGKDHTSIMHSVEVISNELSNSKDLSNLLDDIINKAKR